MLNPEQAVIIFDCDGVLVETEAISARVNQRLLAEIGWNLTLEEIAERFTGTGGEAFTAAVEQHLGGPLGFNWYERYASRYQCAYDQELVAVPGVAEALASIRQPICVASNSSHEHVRSVLRRTGLLGHFGKGRIFSASDVSRPKPAPDLFLHAAKAMGVGPANCVVIEDSLVGIEAARSAEMPVLAYIGSGMQISKLASLATGLVTSMHELPEVIQRLLENGPIGLDPIRSSGGT